VPCATTATCETEQIYVHDDDGTRLIDQTDVGGAGDSLASLALFGSHLTWTHDGIPEQTTLR
jgi:hypothetical protein